MAERMTHKFGGASVRDADAIRKVAEVLSQVVPPDGQAVVVVSAMGKTTNALEEVWRAPGPQRLAMWEELRRRHEDVAAALALPASVTESLRRVFSEAWDEAHSVPAAEAGSQASYDAFVAAGELASTLLVEGWLSRQGMRTAWWDVRETLRTTGPHRFARVCEDDLPAMGTALRARFEGPHAPQFVVTQGFIGRNAAGATTTLGREGSDYSAALLAVAAGAQGVTIWKDVPGMMNADPKRHPDAQTLARVDHAEAMELSYYGASVIHPRTIKPLRKHGLPLWVRSFVDVDGPRTEINAFPGLVPEVPMFIWRDDQALLEVATADGSFLAEDHLTTLFGALDQTGIHVRLMQQSATHFGLVTDHDATRIASLTLAVSGSLEVGVEEGLSLLTVRHGTQEVLDALADGWDVVVEQRAGATWRRVLRATNR
jgi:aspartate kinase